MLLWALLQQIPDWKGRLDFWFDAAKMAGGYAGLAATVINSPLFSVGLAAAGILWLAFVGEPRKGVQRHAGLSFLGWSLVGFLSAAIILTLGWGAIQAYMQTEIVRGIHAGQLPDRHLSESEATSLLAVLRPIASSFPENIQVQAVSASPDAVGYALQFMMIFHAAGLTVNGVAPSADGTGLFPSPAQIRSPEMRGLFIGIHSGIDVKIPERATQFQSALNQAGFAASLTGWNGVAANDFVFVVSYQ